jgi:hypothetical protein
LAGRICGGADNKEELFGFFGNGPKMDPLVFFLSDAPTSMGSSWFWRIMVEENRGVLSSYRKGDMAKARGLLLQS